VSIIRSCASSARAAQSTASVLPAGLRARVWIEARHFFSRDSAQSNCWLWLLRDNGRVIALRVDAQGFGRDDRLPALLAHFVDDDAPPFTDGKGLPAWQLRHAPVVPLTRWAVSWGHPLQHEIRAFAAALDHGILDALGWLEAPGPFFGSVGNYNRLVACPPVVRSHRVQAIEQFPVLVAPLLLDVVGRPDMFGNDEDVPERAALRRAGSQHVLDAIDRGRDLVGALAAHHGVDRALVRSPLLREPLAAGHVSRETLQLLAAMPAHARPRTRDELEAWLPCLEQLPVLVRHRADIERLARVFRGGWDASWQAVETLFRPLPAVLRDCRDFLQSALEQVELPPRLVLLDANRLGLAWLSRRGLASLLQASRRWHAQALVEHRVDDGVPAQVTPVVGQYRGADGLATEILTRERLVEEGENMHHCVGGYWNDCALHAMRIFHCEDSEGAVATAQFNCNGHVESPTYALAELGGIANTEADPGMVRLARQLETLLNDEVTQAQRLLAVQEAAAAMRAFRPGVARLQRPLDLRSRDELRQVLDWCGRQPDWQPREGVLWRGGIAGFAYAQGEQVRMRLACGDALRLVREPGNPHDPRAVRVEWSGYRLGYVPRRDNAGIAAALDAGLLVDGEIVALHREDLWSPIEFIVTARPAEAVA